MRNTGLPFITALLENTLEKWPNWNLQDKTFALTLYKRGSKSDKLLRNCVRLNGLVISKYNVYLYHVLNHSALCCKTTDKMYSHSIIFPFNFVDVLNFACILVLP